MQAPSVQRAFNFYKKPWDPYMAWSEDVKYRNLKPDGKWPAFLSFIVERTEKGTWEELRKVPWLAVPSVYDASLSDAVGTSRFATVRLVTTDIPGEEGKADGGPSKELEVLRRIQELLEHPAVARLQLGYPRGNDRLLSGPSHAALDKPSASALEHAEVVLGFIDDGVPFAHPDLLDDGRRPRMALLWQQGTREPVVDSWRSDGRFGYGRVLDRSAMQQLMAEATRAGVVDESLCYFEAFAVETRDENDLQRCAWRKPSRVLLCRASHGSGVASAAVATRRPDTGSDRGRVYACEADAASRCPLIAVDLPREQADISSGRWLPFNGLDGIRFIISSARSLYARKEGAEPLPVVINLSSGSSAGAHNGEAMFERAMDELLAADDHLAIVLAAGNGREADAHAHWVVPADGQSGVGLFVPTDQPFDTFVEIWLPPDVALTSLAVRVVSPDGAVMEVDTGDPHGTLKRGGTVLAALYLYPDVAQATTRTMVLLAVAGTVVTGKRRQAPVAGPWKIMVTNRAEPGGSPLLIDAWIERDEVVVGNRREQIARFFPLEPVEDTPAGHANHNVDGPITCFDTLSNIATGQHTVVVGAFQGDRSDGPMSDYSAMPAEAWATSTPPSYLAFAAVADAGRSHPGVRVGGNRGAIRQRMNGTSVAAPQAARWLLNRMAKGLGRAAALASLPALPAAIPQHPPNTVLPHDGRMRLDRSAPC